MGKFENVTSLNKVTNAKANKLIYSGCVIEIPTKKNCMNYICYNVGVTVQFKVVYFRSLFKM